MTKGLEITQTGAVLYNVLYGSGKYLLNVYVFPFPFSQIEFQI